MVAIAPFALLAKHPGWSAGSAAALAGAGTVVVPLPWLKAALTASDLVADPAILGDLIVRLAAVLVAGMLAALLTSATLSLTGSYRALLATDEDAPVVRRADAHPDAPARRPLSAADLTSATVDLQARSVPDDLDTLLSAIEPSSIPARPRAPVRPVAALAPGERLQVFRLAPPPSRSHEASEAPNIDALLQRLETRPNRRRPA